MVKEKNLLMSIQKLRKHQKTKRKPSGNFRGFLLWIKDLKHPADFNIHSRKGKPFFAEVFQ